MYQNRTVGVVVPAYNEEGLVGTVIDTIPSFVDRVYVIDDHSTDGTWDEILAHTERANDRNAVSTIATDGGQFDDRVLALRNTENRGVGYTIRRGYRCALRDGIDVVAVMNGDGQMDPDELERIIDPIVSDRADYAKGDRLSHPEHHAEMSFWRLFGNRLLTLLTRVVSGYWQITDSQNGYTAISREALEVIPMDELYDHYGFLNDVLVKLNVYGLRVADVPHQAVYGDEQSGIRYRTFVPMLSLLLMQGFLWRLKRQYFVSGFGLTLLFYTTGITGMLLGSVLWLTSLWRVIDVGTSLDVAAVGPAATVVGVLSTLLAIASDARENNTLQIRPGE